MRERCRGTLHILHYVEIENGALLCDVTRSRKMTRGHGKSWKKFREKLWEPWNQKHLTGVCSFIDCCIITRDCALISAGWSPFCTLWPCDLDPVWFFDLILIVGWGLDYPCAEFSEFSLSRFGFILRTHTHTHTHRITDTARRFTLSLQWVIMLFLSTSEALVHQIEIMGGWLGVNYAVFFYKLCIFHDLQKVEISNFVSGTMSLYIYLKFEQIITIIILYCIIMKSISNLWRL